MNRNQTVKNLVAYRDLLEGLEDVNYNDELLLILLRSTTARMRHALASDQQREWFTDDEFGIKELHEYYCFSTMPQRSRKQTQFWGFD